MKEIQSDPERHGYFYFVAKGEGRHSFAETLSEHNQNLHPVERTQP